MVNVSIYSEKHKTEWDDFVSKSKNGHFIYYRDYIEYHQARFQDFSLLFYDDKNKLNSLLPGNILENDYYSHGGLTYGGVISSTKMTSLLMLSIFKEMMIFLKLKGFKNFFYKTMPYIHHKFPSDEDRYALFHSEAELIRSPILSIINLREQLPYQERRARSIKKSNNHNFKFVYSDNYEEYWKILNELLSSTYHSKPVHNIEEIIYLKNLFPSNIKLFLCLKDEETLAGIVIYETEEVVRAQYIASTPKGKELGALDSLFDYLIKKIYKNKLFFDFGSSEVNSHLINNGLIEHKEGFGARAVVYQHYKIDLTRNIDQFFPKLHG